MTVWTEGHTRLTFGLGEKAFFRYTRRSLNLMPNLGELGIDVRPSLPKPIDLPAGIKMVVVRSQPVSSELPWLQRHGEWLCYVPRQGPRYYVEMTNTFSDYLAKFSAKTRSTLKRKVRKFADASGGTIDWRAYRTPVELAEFHPIARALAARTYQERFFDNALPGDAEFVDKMRQQGELDRVRAFLLFLEGEAVAYLYCPVVGDGILIYEFVGFSPEHAELSPGTVLQYIAFEQLFAEARFKAFDFTEGAGAHKALFATNSVLCADTYYFLPSTEVLATIYAHRAVEQCSRHTGELLKNLGLKARIKRLIRSA